MDGGNLGIITLIPALSFFVFAFVTRKCILSIMLSGLMGYMFYYGPGFFMPTMDAIVDAASDWDNNYIVIICLLFGCLVQLLRQSNGATAMGNWARNYVKSQKQVLLLTWLCGIIIFIDDYLSILVTANTVLPLADEHKTPREMLCYIINTTSAPVCLIIPISAWVVFFSGIFGEQAEAAVVGSSAMEIYYHIMPYFFYPFLCVIFVLLVILGVVPKMGGIKKAYERVAAGGPLWPESSAAQNQSGELGEVLGAITDDKAKEEAAAEPHLWAFLVPMAVVIVSTIWLGDILYGVALGIFTCFITYLPTRTMSLGKFCDACYKGLEDMLFIAAVLVTSLFFRNSINLIGLPDYLIEVAAPFMNAAWLPAIAFVLIGLVCFATANIWSIPAVCTPIILPLAAATGASIPLTLGAVISAACFGAQACFYSDVTLLSASACRINNVDYAVAQLPYIGIVTAITLVMYIVAGFVMA
ncbi:Na+/H+ antiporter family [Slackia heliotrinireducens]|uniref:Na+/H+ antiporter n=1 Tax=Slackia heliotrinireducens (strain ATCC 29202 / DSM 20476 / NCTC 11029 / RHS 1) TaxID=471855 RepID=C7N780_SLAHD|nr:Na+/H+ antiporter NhaC family protein [Slackia heliotrinireducens]ACV22765.1 Na+/H+ antiporter [Slackia heliotrinireducens DSM 20476]VEH01434.1 Na+/H+ antiporter family [Slackia heliotrinireducens]